MGDLQLYGMTNLALGEYRTFNQTLFELVINLDGQGVGN
jgi:hypothetical protein